MTPGEWFKEHPKEKREWLPREQYVELMRQRKKEAEDIRKLHTNYPSVYRGSTAKPGGSSKQSAEFGDERRGSENITAYLSHMSTLCTKTRSDKNHLVQWLCTQFPEEQVAEVLARYRTGSTRDGRIIY